MTIPYDPGTEKHEAYKKILDQIVTLQHELEGVLNAKERGAIATEIREAHGNMQELRKILSKLKLRQAEVPERLSVTGLRYLIADEALELSGVPEQELDPELEKEVRDLLAAIGLKLLAVKALLTETITE